MGGEKKTFLYILEWGLWMLAEKLLFDENE
jgi:hypothetical protein